MEALRRAVQLNPQSIDARRILAQAMMESGDPDSAEKQLFALKALGYKDAGENLLLAGAFMQSNQHYKAIKLLESHLKLHATDVDAVVMLADALTFVDDKDAALRVCNNAITVATNTHDQTRLKEKYTALLNARDCKGVDNSPQESRGS
jgi:thioredoxin-like negative regulator of GroEL